MMLHARTSPEALGFARVVVYAIWLFLLLSVPIERHADFPADWLGAVGVFRFMPEIFRTTLLQPEVLGSLRWAAIALCALLMLGVRPFAPFAFAAAGCLLLLDGVVKGCGGFVNHSQMGLLYAAILLPFFPAADGFSVLGRRRVPRPAHLYAIPMVLAGLCLATAYMLLGIRRFAHGGFGIFTGDAILNYLSVSALNYGTYRFEYGLLPLTHAWMAVPAKISYFVFTLAEITAPLALFFRRFRWVWLPVIASLHVGTMLLMNILFWEQLLLVLVFLGPVAHAFAPGALLRGRREKPIVFYDGVCGLCNGFVNFVVRRDADGLFRFTPLQGETAAAAPGFPSDGAEMSTIVLRDDRGYATRSDAALRVITGLGGIWTLAVAGWLVPRGVRDAVYGFVARNRYRWFGKYDSCPLPEPGLRERFLP